MMRLPSLRLLVIGFGVSLLAACGDPDGTAEHRAHELPIIGHRDVVNGDTVYHTVGDWAFYRQDSALVTEDMLQGTPYVVDFFFTSCPTICPKVTSNMLRAYDTLAGFDELKFVSFTVDPERDSVAHLANYAGNLGVVGTDRWWFLTGDKFDLYEIADDYMSVAVEDPEVPGGFDHSGRILLVDERGRVRAYADGTDDDEVGHFIADVRHYLQSRAQ